jgi:hypothetical protein
MAKPQKARGAGEASVPPAPSSSERKRLEAAVASLSGLNADQLRLQWRNHLGGIPPAHLPGWLLARVLAYRIQAAAFGDLDRAILRRLRETKGEALESGQAPPFAIRGPTTREGVGLKSGALVGTAVSSASWSLTRGMLGMAASTAASRRRPRRSPARIGTDTASSG